MACNFESGSVQNGSRSLDADDAFAAKEGDFLFASMR